MSRNGVQIGAKLKAYFFDSEKVKRAVDSVTRKAHRHLVLQYVAHRLHLLRKPPGRRCLVSRRTRILGALDGGSIAGGSPKAKSRSGRASKD